MIADLNDETTHHRHSLNNLHQTVALLLSDSHTLKKLSQGVVHTLQQRRYANRQASKELLAKEAAVEGMKQTLAALKLKHEQFTNKHWNAQERLNSLDEMVEIEDRNVTKIAAENSRMCGTLFRFSKTLIELRDEHKIKEVGREEVG